MNNIHPSSIIHSDAVLGENLQIGPFCTIGSGVRLGNGCKLISHVVLDGPQTHIGDNNVFYPFCIIGTEPQDLKSLDEQTALFIGNNNIFRESVSIHRGTMTGKGETRLGDNNMLMAYVHIAHDCTLGHHNILTNYVGLSGHVSIDNYVVLGGKAGVVQHFRIGSYAYIGGRSVVDKHIPPYSAGTGDRIKIKGINKIGLQRHGFSKEAIKAIWKAHRLYLKSGLSHPEALLQIQAELGHIKEVALFTDFVEAIKEN